MTLLQFAGEEQGYSIMLSTKQFLLWSLPVALTVFVAGPLAVLHFFDLIPSTSGETKAFDHELLSSSNTSVAQLPDTIPLMFRVAKYPATGRQMLEVHELRLMNLTAFAEIVDRSAEKKKPGALLGYMSVTEALRQKKSRPDSYPVGDLLHVTELLFTKFDDKTGKPKTLVLDTRRVCRFRLNNVQYDEATDLLFGQVD